MQITSKIYGEANANGENGKIVESTTTVQEAKDMYKSVSDNGGFYVGRYEAGYENGKVVVKQDVYVYNNVSWSKNEEMNEEETVEGIEEYPDGAIELSRNFDEVNNYKSVKSTLIYGVQWDAIMTWIDPAYKTSSCESDSFVAKSTGKGNYDETGSWNGSLATTGSNANYAVKNIYDLAGNVEEWTMESFSTNYRVLRGGNYNNSGSSNPASYRNIGNPPYSFDRIGFRVTLYL